MKLITKLILLIVMIYSSIISAEVTDPTDIFDEELVPWDCVQGNEGSGYRGASPSFLLTSAAEVCEADGGEFFILIL